MNQSSQPENHLDNDKDINSIDERIKTQFGLALASEPTEDGKRAIERFYYGFLNNYPGYDYLADQYTQSKLKAFAGDFEALLKNQVLHRIEGANATRGEIRQALKAIKERWNV
jgi:hypothetical protein